MKRIVFVVGAGASCDFKGFPVGSGLAQSIDSQLSRELQVGNGAISDCLSRNGGFGDEHQRAMTRITNGIHSRDSIDQFVDDCGDEPLVAQIAKLAIAHAILTAENVSELRADPKRTPEAIIRSSRDTWLGYICRYANSGINRQRFLDTLEGISFVTFNYDRTIERFLLVWAQAVLGVSPEHAVALVSKVPIMHVFGQVGYLPGLPVSGASEISFGQARSQDIWRSAKGIKTFTEELESAHVQTVRQEINSADTLVFLGFHFHSQNMRLLFSRAWPQAVDVFATTYGMSQRAVARLMTGLESNGCRYNILPEQCWPLMQRHGEELFDL